MSMNIAKQYDEMCERQREREMQPKQARDMYAIDTQTGLSPMQAAQLIKENAPIFNGIDLLGDTYLAGKCVSILRRDHPKSSWASQTLENWHKTRPAPALDVVRLAKALERCDNSRSGFKLMNHLLDNEHPEAAHLLAAAYAETEGA